MENCCVKITARASARPLIYALHFIHSSYFLVRSSLNELILFDYINKSRCILSYAPRFL